MRDKFYACENSGAAWKGQRKLPESFSISRTFVWISDIKWQLFSYLNNTFTVKSHYFQKFWEH